MFGKKDKIIAELVKSNASNKAKINGLTLATNIHIILIVALGLMVILDLVVYLKSWIWVFIMGMT